MNDIAFDPFAGGDILRLAPTTAPQREILASARLSDEANTAFNEAIDQSGIEQHHQRAISTITVGQHAAPCPV